jgi:hypothetical protein
VQSFQHEANVLCWQEKWVYGLYKVITVVIVLYGYEFWTVMGFALQQLKWNSQIVRLSKKSIEHISCVEKWKKSSLLKDFNANIKQGNEALSDIPEGKTEFWVENSFFTWVIWRFSQLLYSLLQKLGEHFQLWKCTLFFFTHTRTVEECNIWLYIRTRVT